MIERRLTREEQILQLVHLGAQEIGIQLTKRVILEGYDPAQLWYGKLMYKSVKWAEPKSLSLKEAFIQIGEDLITTAYIEGYSKKYEEYKAVLLTVLHNMILFEQRGRGPETTLPEKIFPFLESIIARYITEIAEMQS